MLILRRDHLRWRGSGADAFDCTFLLASSRGSHAARLLLLHLRDMGSRLLSHEAFSSDGETCGLDSDDFLQRRDRELLRGPRAEDLDLWRQDCLRHHQVHRHPWLGDTHMRESAKLHDGALLRLPEVRDSLLRGRRPDGNLGHCVSHRLLGDPPERHVLPLADLSVSSSFRLRHLPCGARSESDLRLQLQLLVAPVCPVSGSAGGQESDHTQLRSPLTDVGLIQPPCC
mmetsp:Transcript_2457/g.5866  ORF Transcript_2457/g.5866 Transcript_2457/m.5866 type:complete len:228 (-) Transcript_2457:1650-2333(-)